MKSAVGIGICCLALLNVALAAPAAEPMPVQTVEKSVTVEDLEKQKQAFLERINQYRRQHGLAPLTVDAKLGDDAQWLSQDMADHNYLGHQDSQGRDPFKRMEDFGYTENTYKGENVAAGQETAAEVFLSWKKSKLHNANMLKPQFRVIGIGLAFKSGTTFGWYWATTFGGQASQTP